MKLTCFEYSVIESILKKHAPQLLHWLSDLEVVLMLRREQANSNLEENLAFYSIKTSILQSRGMLKEREEMLIVLALQILLQTVRKSGGVLMKRLMILLR